MQSINKIRDNSWQSSPFQLLVLLFSVTHLLTAQEMPDKRVNKFSGAFWKSDSVIFVKGEYISKYGKDIEFYFDKFADSKYTVKSESALLPEDNKKHLYFFGPIGSFKNLSRYLPQVVKLTVDGFSLGAYSFVDSMTGIVLFSPDSTRFFHIGNSYSGCTQLWQTFYDMSQYLIMENYAVTHHGFLHGDSLDPKNHYDVEKLRKQQLKKKSTRYYDFYYDEQAYHAGIDSAFLIEDAKIENVLATLQFNKPVRKIQCYVYKDILQKYYCSATPGYGNPFIQAWQNHSIGLGPVEHESIHILFENQGNKLENTFFSEGVVGYYYATIDSLKWKKDRLLMTSNPNFPMKELIRDWHSQGFNEMSYAAAAHFTKFLIDDYGLNRFKLFARISDLNSAFRATYNASLDGMINQWKQYRKKNEVVLGPERVVTFRVLTENVLANDTVFITGSIPELGNWNPGIIPLNRINKNTWEKTVKLNEGMILSFKITRGSWEAEQLGDNKNVPENSTLEVGRNSIVEIHAKYWKDRK